MKKALYLFLTLAMLAGCKNDEPRHLIVGDWLWGGSSGGLTGGRIEPKANERTVISFTGKGTFSISNNDTLQISGAYRLSPVKSIYKTGEATGIFTDNVVNHRLQSRSSFFAIKFSVITSLTDSELNVGDNAYDGYGSSFKRLK